MTVYRSVLGHPMISLMKLRRKEGMMEKEFEYSLTVAMASVLVVLVT